MANKRRRRKAKAGERVPEASGNQMGARGDLQCTSKAFAEARKTGTKRGREDLSDQPGLKAFPTGKRAQGQPRKKPKPQRNTPKGGKEEKCSKKGFLCQSGRGPLV